MNVYPRYLRTSEARRYLGGISKHTLQRWRRDYADFPRPFVVGGMHVYDRDELDAWIETQREAQP